MSNERERRERAGTEGEIERNMGKTDEIGKQSIQLTMRSCTTTVLARSRSFLLTVARCQRPFSFPAFSLVPARSPTSLSRSELQKLRRTSRR
jgi:hypothetical protein